MHDRMRVIMVAHQCSLHLSGDVALLGVRDELGEAEVGDLGLEVVVEEDVGGLDVPVDDGRVGELVKVREPPRRPERDPEPLLPVQVRPSHCTWPCTYAGWID